ncbi:MAG: hypothetical protein P8N23_01285 [Methylophilaceae bacterium]|jgi:hypothetical protein|nr:hypothetical protein [Methylophilaceae bacterium]MDG1452935.1 hypothetical protein [Methylophilaceae bacterium]
MKVTYKLLVPALLAGFLLAACAEKEAEAPVEEMTTEEAAPAEEMATEEAASDEPGGYVPTDDELIAGETR